MWWQEITKQIIVFLNFLRVELPAYILFLYAYLREKTVFLFGFLEGNKNRVVREILIKRGRRNRMFLHLVAMAVLTIGIVISPIISDANPFSKNKSQLLSLQAFSQGPSSLSSDDVFETRESEKPRDKIIIYTVEKGDTISSIAKKFAISEETVKWANNLTGDNIVVGDLLKILPVTGIAHKVERGDTVYSIAKKYSSNSQEIVDFPFNDFANPQTFSLVEGQILIVPGGIKPSEIPRFVRQTYVATGPVSITGAGFTWPIQGVITQFYSWFHKGIDIGTPFGAPIVAAQNGKVIEAYSGGWNYGYGIYLVVAGDNGYDTLYSHLSGLNVSVGDRVIAGQTVLGWVGMTGRTTGPHLHFEIKGAADYFNPLSFLR